MAKDKLRMSNKRFIAILSPIIVFLLAAIITVTCVMNFYGIVMDKVFGQGTRHVINVEGTESWDTKYYDIKYETSDEALKAASDKSKEVCDEGYILMKNSEKNGKTILPLAEKSKVTPFGFHYTHPVYSILGSGSVYDSMGYGNPGPYNSAYNCTNKYSVTMSAAIKENFTVNETVEQRMNDSQYVKIDAAEGTTPCKEFPNVNQCEGGNTYLYEYDPAIFNGTESSCADTAGIVFIGRDAGEGGDLKFDAYADGTPHQLTLSESEKEIIEFAKANCDKGVVAVINSGNAMELDELVSGDYAVDAIVWIGFPGSVGSRSLSDILCGKVNPSGRTVDTWVFDLLSDPTTANLGQFVYTDSEVAETSAVGGSFIEYEEGIYVGYKYYETANEMDSSFDYDKSVVFPFGYGLSYTTFEQKITGYSDVGNEINVTVSVTNTGDRDGKEVVQLYYTAPYTDFDKTNKIEKSVKNLIAFDKVEVAKGATEEVTLTFLKEDMASYCYTRDNGDGTKGCYVLENGEYTITLGKNSHDIWDSRNTTVVDTVWYDKDNPRQSERNGQSLLDENGDPTGIPSKSGAKFIAATNLFQDSSDYMNTSKVTLLTRADWKNTYPTAPSGESFTVDKKVSDIVDRFSKNTFDYETDPLLGNVKGSAVYHENAPVSNADNGLVLADMRGLDYYDESWDLLLDQIDYSATDELVKLLYGGAYTLGGLSSIGMPSSNSGEGPSGIGIFAKMFAQIFGGATALPETCAYAANVVIASTWNVELSYDVGESVAQEAFHFILGEGNWLCGWTGPAMNLHRSAFNGRNAEYYSEDPVLAGNIGASEVSGAGDNGLYMIFKHFALNNVETAKTMGDGICTWADEQTMREQYFKIFEKVFKDSRRRVKYIVDEEGTVKTRVVRGATSVMTAFNRIGAVPAGSDYNFITKLLKEEWGFQGFVQTDMPCQSNKDQMLRAGGAVEMNMSAVAPEDLTSPTARHQIRRAVHDIAFAVVNSSVMQGAAPGAIIYYDMSPWAITLMVVDIIVGVIVIAGVVWIVLRVLDEKKHPEKYKRKEKV